MDFFFPCGLTAVRQAFLCPSFKEKKQHYRGFSLWFHFSFPNKRERNLIFDSLKLLKT